ncbi:hypothetical protein GNP81_16290 [Aliivibrio fischeri]|uniref:hypothetical protein n=1 Tax=Aliivibrio fischeri TaxID=668 RepID=UPI0012D90C7F|nr:hypothetical protein [Aliivibrio fischeri]MUK62734.1 hypothetical protein [Aliivibrio fischeri]MUL22366.1 hypothetical protein [Aliivibrio fischeri]MUL26157.1 hypothetical protein [Aliivibrio fischeri]
MLTKMFNLALLLVLSGCSATKTEVATEKETELHNVSFIIGNITSIYDIKLSLGKIDFENAVFKEDWFSSLSYQYTKDRRYIVGTAKAGSFIAITSTKAQDASGAPLGTFTPCNQTLVFQLPYDALNVYVTDVNYQWNNVSITPMYSNEIEEAMIAFKTSYIKQAAYRQLPADLYQDCETLNPNPLIMTRPI